MNQEQIQQLFIKHAEKDYPNECCGFVLVKLETGELRVRTCRNTQNQRHAENALLYPRTAKQAFWMDSKDLVQVQKELRENGEKISIIYHSHIDAPAYFSLEDKTMAVMDGEPLYPEVDYLVISVCSGKVKDWKIFSWDSQIKEYTMSKKITQQRGSVL